MASHELKTPVTSLKGFTQILQRRLKQQADPQTLLFLERMDAQLKRLTNLISDLLDVSKMQAGTLAFREISIDLDELVREIVENEQATTTTHHLCLQGATHAQVYGDRDRLGQVLINLLSNATKYSPQADTVIVRLSSDHEQAEVAVQDFGIGIAEVYHQRLFERFYRVNPQENTYPGPGIGLYIAHTIIELHGGRLWLESRKGAGSTFRFTLPLLSREPDTSHPPTRGEEVQ
jgi:signal transduction histidine kinase